VGVVPWPGQSEAPGAALVDLLDEIRILHEVLALLGLEVDHDAGDRAADSLEFEPKRMRFSFHYLSS
jgi:hypothetical protein